MHVSVISTCCETVGPFNSQSLNRVVLKFDADFEWCQQILLFPVSNSNHHLDDEKEVMPFSWGFFLLHSERSIQVTLEKLAKPENVDEISRIKKEARDVSILMTAITLNYLIWLLNFAT